VIESVNCSGKMLYHWAHYLSKYSYVTVSVYASIIPEAAKKCTKVSNNSYESEAVTFNFVLGFLALEDATDR